MLSDAELTADIIYCLKLENYYVLQCDKNGKEAFIRGIYSAGDP